MHQVIVALSLHHGLYGIWMHVVDLRVWTFMTIRVMSNRYSSKPIKEMQAVVLSGNN